MNNPFNVKRLWPLSLTLLLAASFSACDVLEDDDPIGGGKGVVIDDSDVKMLSQGTAYIDLYARVKTERPIRLDITADPARGTLRELRTGLLQYQANVDFTQGRDFFRVSVYAEDNTLLLEDTVGIVIEDDITNLPCGVYTRSDSAQVSGDSTVYIYPLSNDLLCGDSARYRLEIYKPGAAQPPYYGTAMVNTPYNSISYAPTSNPPKNDLIIYKVYDITDTTRVGYGIIFITPASTPGEEPEEPCQFLLIDDSYTVVLDTLRTDSLTFRPFENDSLCDHSWNSYTLSIAGQGGHGNATALPSGLLLYELWEEPYHGMQDSVVYRGCRGDTCRTAKIRIYFN
jgi:hypothetical protein